VNILLDYNADVNHQTQIGGYSSLELGKLTAQEIKKINVLSFK
jgi:hypothetical protein